MAATFARIRTIRSRIAALQPRQPKPMVAMSIHSNVHGSTPDSVNRASADFGRLLQGQMMREATHTLSDSSNPSRGNMATNTGNVELSTLLGFGQLLSGTNSTTTAFGLPDGFARQPTTQLTGLLELSNGMLPRITHSPQKYNPFRDVEVTSPFGDRVFNGVAENHRGVDFAVKEGTLLPSVGSGQILRVGESTVFGREVVLRLDSGEVIQYGHLSSKAPFLVKEGQRVGIGEIIAMSGNTGRSTGPHVHVSVQIADRYIDPEEFLSKLL